MEVELIVLLLKHNKLTIDSIETVISTIQYKFYTNL